MVSVYWCFAAAGELNKTGPNDGKQSEKREHSTYRATDTDASLRVHKKQEIDPLPVLYFARMYTSDMEWVRAGGSLKVFMQLGPLELL